MCSEGYFFDVPLTDRQIKEIKVRYLTFIAVSFTVLIAAGSIYLHIDTKHFVENLSQPQNQSVHQKGPAAVAPLSPPKEPVAPSADTSETPSKVPTQKENETQTYDWRNDQADHGHTHAPGDPWQHTHAPGEISHWSDIQDPYERADAYRATLREEFGEAPEVDTLVKLSLKRWTGGTMDPHEMSEFVEAHQTLMPSEKTESLKTFPPHTHTPPSQQFLDLRHQFSDIEPFVAEHGFEEGILRFSEQNPERALEFKRRLFETNEVESVREEMPEEAQRFFNRFFKEITSLE